jgi:beta-lactamase regulating signal transducer with metallopeptidase domain
MVAMSVQVVVVVLVVAILDRFLVRRAHPRLAAALWLAALAKLALPPTLESPVGLGVGLAPSASGVATAAFWIWLAGATAFAALAIRRHYRLGRELLGDSIEPAADVAQAARDAARRLGLRRAPQIRVLPGLAVPCVVGFFRPVVLLPDGPANGHALLHGRAHPAARSPHWASRRSSRRSCTGFHPPRG